LKQKNQEISLAITGNSRLIRELFCTAFECDEQIKVIAEVENKNLTGDMTRKLRPDVILLYADTSLSDTIAMLPKIRNAHRGAKVLVIAFNLRSDDIQALVKAGVRGYISTKSACKSDLISAIRAISRDEFWIERKMIARILEGEFNKDIQIDGNGQNPKNVLTKREKEILVQIAKGLSNKEIAHTLYISDNTVKCHIYNIFRKLNLNRRGEAILFAIGQGFLNHNGSNI